MSLTLSRNIGEKIFATCSRTGKKGFITFAALDVETEKASFIVEEYVNERLEVQFEFTIGLDEVSPTFFGGEVSWGHSNRYKGHQIRAFLAFPRSVSLHRVLKDGTILMPKKEAV